MLLTARSELNGLPASGMRAWVRKLFRRHRLLLKNFLPENFEVFGGGVQSKGSYLFEDVQVQRFADPARRSNIQGMIEEQPKKSGGMILFVSEMLRDCVSDSDE